MKFAPSALAACILVASPLPASAQQVPSKIAGQTPARCVADHPDDDTLQAGCIGNLLREYLEVGGGEAVRVADMTGVPSAADVANIRNAAYLSVAQEVCGLSVGDLVERYKERALASDRNLTEAQVDTAISNHKTLNRLKAMADREEFCAEVERNLPNFQADLGQQ